MKKFRFFVAFLAFLLCASMILTACGKKDKTDEDDTEETETEEVTEEVKEEAPKEPVTYKLADIMNKDWKVAAKEVFSSYAATDFVGEAKGVSAYGFLVTVQADAQDPNKDITRVYNMVTGKEILKIEENNTETEVDDTTPGRRDEGRDGKNTTVTYKNGYVNVISESYFAVLGVTTVDDEYGNLTQIGTFNTFSEAKRYDFAEDKDDSCYAKYTLTIYDAEGKAVKTVGEKEFESRCQNDITKFDNGNSSVYNNLKKDYIPARIGVNNAYMVEDLLIDGTKVYRVDAKGAQTLVKDFGLSRMPEFKVGSFKQIGEKYLEYRQYPGNYIEQYTVYSKDLVAEVTYDIPTIAFKTSVNLLANGNLLVQNSIVLSENEETYDYIGVHANKFELKTFIVTKDGITELEDVNYLIADLVPSVVDLNGQRIYSDKIENLAFIHPIAEDKTLDESTNNVKLVALSNDLKTVNEVICPDKLTTFPYPVNDDIFRARIASGGVAYYNENGEKISVINDFYKAEKYFYEDGEGVYDLKGSLVYDFKKNNVTDAAFCGDSLLLTYVTYDENGEKINYGIFVDGEVKPIANEVVYIWDGGIYAVKNTVGKDGTTVNYSYYNEKAVAIGTFADKLVFVAEGNDYVIMRSSVENKFYKFVKAVQETK